VVSDHQAEFELAAVTIRRAGSDDEDALRRLADLDSTRVPEGPLLMAEIAGVPVAAISIASGESVADPFVPLRPSPTPRYGAWRTTGRRLALASSSRRTGVV
jgi:hypothetical protein